MRLKPRLQVDCCLSKLFSSDNWCVWHQCLLMWHPVFVTPSVCSKSFLSQMQKKLIEGESLSWEQQSWWDQECKDLSAPSPWGADESQGRPHRGELGMGWVIRKSSCRKWFTIQVPLRCARDSHCLWLQWDWPSHIFRSCSQTSLSFCYLETWRNRTTSKGVKAFWK